MERLAFKKAVAAKFNDDDTYIGTRYCSLGHYFCQFSIFAKESPTAQNVTDYNNIRNIFTQMGNKQVYDLVRTIKFNIPFVKYDSEFCRTSRREEADPILLKNEDYEQWTTTHPGLKFNEVYIVAHDRSKLTGAPYPERIFNKIVLILDFPENSNPIEVN